MAALALSGVLDIGKAAKPEEEVSAAAQLASESCEIRNVVMLICGAIVDVEAMLGLEAARCRAAALPAAAAEEVDLSPAADGTTAEALAAAGVTAEAPAPATAEAAAPPKPWPTKPPAIKPIMPGGRKKSKKTNKKKKGKGKK